MEPDIKCSRVAKDLKTHELGKSRKKNGIFVARWVKYPHKKKKEIKMA